MLFKTQTGFFLFVPPPLGVKGSDDFTTVRMSVGKRVFSKTVDRIFLKLLMKFGCLKGKKLTKLDFWGKNLIFRIMPKNALKIGCFLKKIIH